MKTGEWEKVNRIVSEALELAAARRQKFIEDTCADAPDLRVEVESLLVGEAGAEDFFSSPAVLSYADFFENTEEETADDLAGQEIGNYRILREIGRGGMGAVYLAERADGKFSQRVAVKMLKRELNTGDFRRNFNREKEILARLSHPNIAALVNAGTTADGVPYLVMEYVEGVPIDAFCREKALSLNERLKLFNIVCGAVAFAHRNLIVHRDLKPSNILVTGDGVPKLLDFGISKLLDAPPNAEQPMTIPGALTPQYASPEQIRGETVSTATDVYSLGVVLFKILTGNFPYDFQHDTNGAIFRTITDTEPSRPSSVVNPESRIPNPKSLKGDLDNIILKALSKEPERRYKTIEQFAADIWRYVDGLPVAARPATFAYRAKKFYRRNRVSVVAGVLIFLSLAVGIVVAVSQAQTAQLQAVIAFDARQQAEHEAERARAEQKKAEKISRFMAQVISYANPAWYAEGAKFGGDTKVIEAMDDLSEKIDVQFEGQPDIQAELHHKFAEVYNFDRKSGRIKESERKELYHATRALELRKQFYGERHELVAKDLYYLRSAGGVESGEYTEENVAKTFAKAIQMMRETNPMNLNLPYMLGDYSGMMVSQPDAEWIGERCLRAGIAPTIENRRRVAAEIREIYLREAMQPGSSQYQLVESYMREALPILRFHYEKDNYAIYMSECTLAYALAMQDKWTDFDEHYDICKNGQEKINSLRSADEKITTLDYIEKVLAEKNRGK